LKRGAAPHACIVPVDGSGWRAPRCRCSAADGPSGARDRRGGRPARGLCDRADAYRWICGSVVVNQHTLSDFRVQNGKRLDDLLAQLVGVLMRQGLVNRKRVAQDGMRLRANAGRRRFAARAGSRAP
jgi:hypothetical protein